MRKIKFRGKRVEGGWICGDLIQYKDGSNAIINIPFSKYGYEATEILNRNRVIPKTVGQFTGLQDKNGKDIYEGDKLQYCDEDIYYTVKSIYGLAFDNINTELNYKIIGNIHEEKKWNQL